MARRVAGRGRGRRVATGQEGGSGPGREWGGDRGEANEGGAPGAVRAWGTGAGG